MAEKLMTDTRASQTLKTAVKEKINLEDFIVPAEEDFIARDRRNCDCPLTYVHRKRHGALGTGIEIRLCCLAKKVEELAGLPPGTFFFAMDFEPTWTWDCEQINKKQRKLLDGSIEETFVKQGAPPKWLLKRMKQKGIKVRNLPRELEEGE
jgi:hypothetical protein